jgi:hypothetical protein
MPAGPAEPCDAEVLLFFAAELASDFAATSALSDERQPEPFFGTRMTPLFDRQAATLALACTVGVAALAGAAGLKMRAAAPRVVIAVRADVVESSFLMLRIVPYLCVQRLCIN